MSDEPRMTPSEVKARTERACEKGRYHYFPAASHALFHDIPHLLELVERLGKALEWALQQTYDSSDAENPKTGKREFHEGYAEARALLKEIEQ